MNRLSFLVVTILGAILFSIPNSSTAAWQDVCEDRSYDVLGVPVPCGCHTQSICLSGNRCDKGHRDFFSPLLVAIPPNFGKQCIYSGYSEEPANDVIVPSQAGRETLWGWSDVHEHQFANLAYGGAMFWGAPFDYRGINAALAFCDYTWDFVTYTPSLVGELLSMVEYPPEIDWVLGPLTDVLALLLAPARTLPDLYGRGYPVHGDHGMTQFLYGLTNNVSTHGMKVYQHLPQGTGTFTSWPRYDQGGHQQMYYKWLERAYQGGLRLMVNHAVNNQALCWLSFTRAGIRCDDMIGPDDTGVSTVDRQIQAMWDLQAFIDDQSGGTGKGWYRIATSAADARNIIRSGKMAVVIGIEVDTLFGCGPEELGCDSTYVREQIALYKSKGVRHIFPVHFFDNKFSGGALYDDIFKQADELTDLRPVIPWNCYDEGFRFQLSPSDTDWADCNSRGLMPEGRDLIDALIEADMIIDIDHLSHRALQGYWDTPQEYQQGVLEILEDQNGTRGYGYPTVSGHPMILEEPTAEFQQSVETIERIRNIGGIASVNMARGRCYTSQDFLEGTDDLDYPDRHAFGYTEIVDLMNGGAMDDSPFYGEGFPGISLITDMGAFLNQTGPRFSGDPVNDVYHADPACAKAFKTSTALDYPFDPFEDGAKGQFHKQVTGDRTFNFNTDGLAHIGLMPDLIADTMNVGVTREELDPLFNSAETFVRMWERVDNCTPDELPPLPDADPLPAVHGVCSATVTEVPTASDQCHYEAIHGTTADPFDYHAQGIHTVTWAYTDEQGNSSTQNQIVSVIDNVPPVIDELSASPDLLWPPSNQMVSITVTAVASDNCDAAPFCRITAVSSNEPEEGSASKKKVPDWEVSGDLMLDLRAEKAKSVMDRVYEIEVTCTDYAGNDTTGQTEVSVPHDQDKKSK